MRDDASIEMREMDRWLRKAAFIGTITSFIVGWGSGVFTTYLFFKNHELRITMIESKVSKIEDYVLISGKEHARVLETLSQKLGVRIP